MNWEQRYQEGAIPWEKGKAAPPLAEIWERFGNGIWGDGKGDVLVPGCGYGHDARWLAAKGLSVLGLDVSAMAVDQARELTAGGNPRFERGDFFVYPSGNCQAIFEHTCFCAIPRADRYRYAETAARLLAQGAYLVGVFFLNPDNDGDGPPQGCSLEELDERFGRDFEVIAEWSPEIVYPGREDREWVRIMRRR